ncbi:MAG: adenosylcobinamide-GDP ribazoletransferase, partial [Selenomonas sp.]|nr:adenosylcobinamide-GDP ribazoletransferase [Selenomonas sp.]
MRLFFVALQFLTRIHIVKQDSWTADDFGHSTRFFPLVGLVQGVIYLLFAWLMLPVLGQSAVFASLMLILTIIITGGLHYDGFMDTMDGLLSARSRERMLEIMKDSRVGSYGALAAI